MMPMPELVGDVLKIQIYRIIASGCIDMNLGQRICGKSINRVISTAREYSPSGGSCNVIVATPCVYLVNFSNIGIIWK